MSEDNLRAMLDVPNGYNKEHSEVPRWPENIQIIHVKLKNVLQGNKNPRCFAASLGNDKDEWQ
jgi:hypothetical protein